jgi:hypothetical protein
MADLNCFYLCSKMGKLKVENSAQKKFRKTFCDMCFFDVSVIEFVVKLYHVDSHW